MSLTFFSRKWRDDELRCCPFDRMSLAVMMLVVRRGILPLALTRICNWDVQRYGPPPSYPHLKIPGLNAPIPDGASFGYHPGGWGKPPVDEVSSDQSSKAVLKFLSGPFVSCVVQFSHA